MVIHADQDISGVGRHDEFHRDEGHHHMRHPGGATGRGGEIAQSALRLVGDAVLQDFLIFGRERRLLSLAPRLGLVVRGLTGKPGHGEARPLAPPIGVLLVLRLSAADRQGKGQCTRRRRDEAPVQHDCPSVR